MRRDVEQTFKDWQTAPSCEPVTLWGGVTGDAGEPTVVLAVWAVLLAGLAARKFRWD